MFTLFLRVIKHLIKRLIKAVSLLTVFLHEFYNSLTRLTWHQGRL